MRRNLTSATIITSPRHFDCSFLATGFGGLGLLLTAGLLHTVLGIFLTTTTSLAFLALGQACALQAVRWLELLHLVKALVDKAETAAAATAERRVEAEERDKLRVLHLVHGRQLSCKVLLGHVRHARMDDVADELLASQQGVLLELTSADGEFAAHCAEGRASQLQSRCTSYVNCANLEP